MTGDARTDLSVTIDDQMRLWNLLLLAALCARPAVSQDAGHLLESIAIDGTSIPRPVVLEVSGLRAAAPIDESGIKQACKKLQESGLFSSIAYRYAPGKKNGYALTLTLTDQTPLVAATIDVPGADENEAWLWLSTKFQRFQRQVPQTDGAQQFLALELERHIGGAMRGQHMTVRMETDFRTRRMSLSFQPEVLPRTQSVVFTGNQAVAAGELSPVLNKVVANSEYTDRRFASALELNLRPVYEEHGFYRVQFTPGRPQWSDAGVSVSVAIAEGPAYQLGNVEIVGDDLPVDAMLSAAKFPGGKLANWRMIQNGIWEMEKIVKRTGFFEAAASPDRSYDDAARLLNLRIRLAKGPLYHFGEVHFIGLNPELESKARGLWKAKPGDPYDYAYPNDFLQAFSRTVDLRRFRKYDATEQKGIGDHVMDVNLVFQPK